MIWFCFIPFEETVGKDGEVEGDVWISGAIVYAAVVMLANFRLLNSFNNYTFWGELLIFLSILSYFVLFYIENLYILFP